MTSFKTLAARTAAFLHLLTYCSATPFALSPRDLLTPIAPSSSADVARWSPALDYDRDCCYNTVAISPSGQYNAGQDSQKNIDEVLGFCRNENRLSKTNVYARAKCNGGWCAYMYDYYFESDHGIGGHRHDWEHIVVWVKGGDLSFVSVSAHGKWITRKASSGIRMEQGTHAKIVYHKNDIFGFGTRCFRFANDKDEPAENQWHSWRWGAGAGLIEWGRMNHWIQALLSKKDWGTAQMAVRSDPDGGAWNFGWYLDQSRKLGDENLAPEFNPWA